jgi:hypothetical protein
MRSKLLIFWIATITVVAALTGPARAEMIAGWDFSQWFGDGLLSTDGEAFTDTLDANYSDLDPTFGAGAESAAFGTLYLNGQFGSTNVGAGSGSEPFLPTAAVPGSLTSNLGAPGGVDFESFGVLLSEGQTFQNALAMTASSVVSVVFQADLSSIGSAGGDWSVSFGGQTFSGTAVVGVDFSTNGINYTPFGTFDLTTIDTPFSRTLGSDVIGTAFVRFNFAAGAGQPIIDNVAISATVIPEPASALLCGLGMLGLGVASRRRRGTSAT